VVDVHPGGRAPRRRHRDRPRRIPRRLLNARNCRGQVTGVVDDLDCPPGRTASAVSISRALLPPVGSHRLRRRRSVVTQLPVAGFASLQADDAGSRHRPAGCGGVSAGLFGSLVVPAAGEVPGTAPWRTRSPWCESVDGSRTTMPGVGEIADRPVSLAEVWLHAPTAHKIPSRSPT